MFLISLLSNNERQERYHSIAALTDRERTPTELGNIGQEESRLQLSLEA